MKLKIPARLAHRSIPVSWCLLVGAAVVPSDPWPLLAVGFLLILTGMSVGAMAYLHAAVGGCPDCEPMAARKIPTWRDRAWATYGRYGWVAVGAGIAGLFTVGAIVGDDDSHAVSVAAVGVVTVASLYLSAKRFVLINGLGEHPHPIRDFTQERLTGLVHQGHWFEGGALIVSGVTGLLPDRPAWNLLHGVAFAVFVAAMYVNGRHGRTLCEDCITEFRTDAPEYADRHKRRLDFRHRQLRVLMPALAVALLVQHWAPEPWAALAMTALYVAFLVSILLDRFHSRYQPWCPVCGDQGGGGDDERELAPEPGPTHGRPLPVA